MNLLYPDQRGDLTSGYIDNHAAPGGATVGVNAWIYSSFSEIKLSAPSSWGILEGENALTRVPFYCKEERMDSRKLSLSVLL